MEKKVKLKKLQKTFRQAFLTNSHKFEITPLPFTRGRAVHFIFILTIRPIFIINKNYKRCRRRRDRIVVGFTTIYAIGAYHH